MDIARFSPETRTAIDAARSAGAIALARFKQEHAVRWKGVRDIVTEVDVEAERAILAMLAEKFPADAVLSEERGWVSGDRKRTWVVDPLDGTTNYSIHEPFFAASVAFCAQQADGMYAVRSGAIFSPVSGELFVAELGKGAWMMMNGEELVQMGVDQGSPLVKGIVSYCRGHEDPERERIVRLFSAFTPEMRDFKRMGAGTLELAFVAAGRTLAHLSGKGKPWDAAAGQLLVREAGGKVTDFAGKEWVLDLSVNQQDILASNGAAHAQLLALIRSAERS